MAKIKVGIVNYLNTKPLLYGIKHSPVINSIELVPDYPSNIAALLLANKIDIGLVPVEILPLLPNASIVTNYCIGCTGPVASVCLLSEVPLKDVTKILLDYQSRTSANLIKILFAHHWKQQVEWIDTTTDFRNQIKGTTAALVIGDRCLDYRNSVGFVYDLGEAWYYFTGLPFVFAAWVSNKNLPADFIDAFNAANQFGVQSIEKVALQNIVSSYDSQIYFTKNIQYELNNKMMEGLKLFLSYLEEAK